MIWLASVAWSSRVQPILGRTMRVAVTMFGFVALSGVVIIGQGVLFSWQARHLNSLRPLHQRAEGRLSSDRSTRLIWIVLDELSYRQVYEHPYQGLKLPAFTELASTATVFTHVVPSGLYTEQVLPSLMTGRQYDDVRTSVAGWPLEVHDRSSRTWGTLDPHKTIFQDALDAGYSTAIAGWYNPYCRILPEVLDSCFWTNHIDLPGAMYPAQSIGWNSYQPIVRHFVNLARMARLLAPQEATSTEVSFHQQDYQELIAAGDILLREPSANFVLLHMPIPHPGGIYNRHTGSFAVSHPTYIDNLALCDVYLAHVRHELEENGTWNNSALVIMGDHSWRVHMGWGKSREWTEEERIASDNVTFDDRPAYIVKLPGQTTPAHIDEPFESIRTRELFDKLLTGQIETPEQLSAWAMRRP
ncbi:sulfatase-like hydrolase/transferase [Tunturiibacter empetritectus]